MREGVGDNDSLVGGHGDKESERAIVHETMTRDVRKSELNSPFVKDYVTQKQLPSSLKCSDNKKDEPPVQARARLQGSWLNFILTRWSSESRWQTLSKLHSLAGCGEKAGEAMRSLLNSPGLWPKGVLDLE